MGPTALLPLVVFLYAALALVVGHSAARGAARVAARRVDTAADVL